MSKFFGSTMKSANSQMLETWLTKDHVERLSEGMKGWYGPPIAVRGVPGDVFATADGDFIGNCKMGGFASGYDFADALFKKRVREEKARLRNRMIKIGRANKQLGMAGFSSYSDLIAEATTGKRRDIYWNKVGPTGVVAVTSSLWRVGPQPAVGANPAAAPGGTALTGATTGAQYGLDNVSPDTRHYVSSSVVASVASNTLLMYDRTFHVLKTMNSSITESVTGVPTRYQSSTASDPAYAGGSFAFVEIGSIALAATAHNWTVCLYRNQANTDNQTFPSMVGNSAGIVDRLDHPVSSWFMPLQTGDTGVMDLAQMQCSAAVATGVINFVIGHPIAWLPCPIINLACKDDGITTAFNFVRVYDDAALAFLELSKPSTGTTTYTGTATFVHG